MHANGEHSPPLGEKKKTIGFFSLLVISFFWVNGGCYGNEALFQAAPPGLVFPLLLIVPFLYSVPIGLITLELSSALPLAGGQVSWIEEAWPGRVAGHNSYWVFVGYVIDAAIYPALAGEYMVDAMADSAMVEFLGRRMTIALCSMLIVIVVLAIKLIGTDVLVKFNTLLAFCSLVPAALFIYYGFDSIQPSQFVSMEMRGGINWSLLFAWQLWLNCGFFGLGSLAGEVENPKQELTSVLVLLIPFVIFINSVPLMVALGVDSDLSHYSVGYFERIANIMTGSTWLGTFMNVGAQVVMIGLYNAQIMVAERAVSQFFRARFPHLSESMMEKGGRWGFLYDRHRHGVEPMYIIATSAVNIVLVWLPYEMLVEGGILISVVPAILLFLVFVYFKWRRPHMPRPYAVGGGVIASCLLVACPLCINVAYIVLSAADSTPVMGIKYVNLCIIVSVVGGGLLVEQLYAAWWSGRPRVTMLMKDEADTLMSQLTDVLSPRDSVSKASKIL